MAQKRKPSKKKPTAKRPQRKKTPKQKIQPPEEILFRVEGKMSTFGGPKDTGMSADEGLALFSQADLQDPKYSYLFLPTPPPGTTELGRRLNPDKYYFACRWNYTDTPREFLKRALARVENPSNGRSADARPVDWGPNISTGRVADLSPGLAAALGLQTDDVVRITISALRAMPVKPVVRTSSSARCTRKPRSLPGSRLTCELTSRPELAARAYAFVLCQARCVELVYLVRLHSI